MLELLFSSSARVKVLTLFLMNPRNRYYQREVASLTHLPIRAVQRELAKMERIGLIGKSFEGNRVYYQANTRFFLFPELKSIILKTVGLGSILQENLEDEQEIQLAFIFGSYAEHREGTESDIDLLVVGDIISRKLHSLIKEAERTTGRVVNYLLYTPEEFRKKVRRGEHFVTEVLRSAKIFVKGSPGELQKIIGRGKNSPS